LGFAGILYLTIAYCDRRAWLGYLGLALLELDWVLLLIDQGLREPQLYAIPAGLYFVFIGYLERRQGRKWFAVAVESLGFAVLLVTSYIQSLDGDQGLPYFLLLLAEGMLVLWWGGTQRRKLPFFIGIGANVLNVVSQIVVLVRVYEVQRWIVILGVGIILVTAAVFVERKRERIIAQVQEWSEQLETWE
jgi:peptidoglycan/LPS O-acetylase OafA/YrhL